MKQQNFNMIELEQNNQEYHIPGYKFCGPGTKVFTRLKRGDKGINKLDEACKCHDVEYMMYAGDDKKLKKSDNKLRKAAQEIGGLSAFLVDKVFLMKNYLEKIGLISPSNFAQKLSTTLTIPQQRRLGYLLYNKYILKHKNINLTDYS